MTSILAENFGSSESEGEDFNPAAHVSDDEDVRQSKKTKRISRKPSVDDDEDDAKDVELDGSPAAVANGDEEDDILDDDEKSVAHDDDDEDDDEEEEVSRETQVFRPFANKSADSSP
jgi:hypothetical protein